MLSSEHWKINTAQPSSREKLLIKNKRGEEQYVERCLENWPNVGELN
jgi:hypothetical protein